LRRPTLKTSHRNPFKKADDKPEKPQRAKPLKDRDRVGKRPGRSNRK
jgi:hypothetical protein